MPKIKKRSTFVAEIQNDILLKTFQVGVIIATAFQQTDSLFNRSLKSVLNQIYLPDLVVIVDDNQNENEFEIISERINKF